MKSNRGSLWRLGLVYLISIASAAVPDADAKEIPRTEYLKFLPLEYPQLVQQNAATDELHLYGDSSDPSYRDLDPVDGIDDERHRLLMALAVRFAPYLVQNTGDIPVNFDIYAQNRSTFPLHVDTWDVSSLSPQLVDTATVNMSALGPMPCSASGSRDLFGVGSAGLSDACKLAELLSRFSPSDPRVFGLDQPLVRQRPDLFTVLFLDYPGSGESSWSTAYEPEYRKTPPDKRATFPQAQVHPFLQRVDTPPGSPEEFEFVLQYWFFYPTNDGGNNHEGDWEHLNVLIAPKSAVEHPLSRDTVERILSGELPPSDTAPDPLVIRRVDYYFHHFVMMLDFGGPNAYAPREAWEAQVKDRKVSRLQENDIWKHIRHMAFVDDDESIINTHPFAYIGADNKGLDQGLAPPGGKNRNSHGTFPFPGRYGHIGPAGATEQISVKRDARTYWKRRASGHETEGPTFKRGSVLGLDDPARLRILPDWERLIEPIQNDPKARGDWAWMLLPIRWGYPATESPFAGIVAYTETGNASPVGPTYSLGWNVAGPAPDFHAYEPHIISSVFPTGVQDGFKNNLGFLNFTLPVLINLPPLDFVSRVVAYPARLALGQDDPAYYPKETVPFRFIGVASGVSWQTFDDGFAALAFNPAQYDEFVIRFLEHLVESGSDSTTTVTRTDNLKSDSVQPFYQVSFFIGDRFTSVNTFRNARSSFGFTAEFNNIPPYRYEADLDLWEYAGSVRYSVLTSAVRPYLKAGYGWSWYRLENVEANGEPFDPPKTAWTSPSIWPNTWHFGLGLEYIPWRRPGRLPRGAELAIHAEYARYTQSLDLDLSSISLEKLQLLFPTLGDVPGGDRVWRTDLVLGLTLTF